MKVSIVVADSVTALPPNARGAVLVTGSHGGLVAAHYASSAGVRAAIFNDAGRGCDDAAIAGVVALDAAGVAAAAVAHTSARIADAADTLARGIVSYANPRAASLGVVEGMTCRDAVERLRAAPMPSPSLSVQRESRTVLVAAGDRAVAILGFDSIGGVLAGDTGAVLVIGSHGALHGGDPASALPVAAVGAFFHDAGGGRDGAGFTRLPILDVRGIAAATVDYRSARIGDARSMWETGALSRVNAAATACGIVAGMRVDAAARELAKAQA
ncbi:MAG: hypothetical protein ABI585_07505 [Betaproteobacteria bacterium]